MTKVTTQMSVSLDGFAQQQLGSRFDIREFHDQVVDSGALPLDVLEEQINLWIAQKAGAKAN